jgi:predicted O-methyltransferase YrrM
MNIDNFLSDFYNTFNKKIIEKPTWYYDFYFVSRFFDRCRDVEGLLSIKKQKLLNIAYKNVSKNESYLEVGTYKGKSLIAAMYNNKPKKTFACDNFGKENMSYVLNKLKKYKLNKYVTFYNCDFLEIFSKEKLPFSVGAYFYDGEHDEESQYLAIKKAEPFLSNTAIVIIDDWRFAKDSRSYAKKGTERAIRESSNQWELLLDLPARFNGNKKMWWNGVAVFGFKIGRNR